MNNFGNLKWTLLCATALALPGVAYGQAGNNAEEVVVTGSLTIRDSTKAPTPLTVVSTEQLQETTPSNIPDGLNKLPVFLGSNSTRTSGTVTNNNAGNALNLRNLGANRALVLLDGKRLAPSNFTGTINVDGMPEMLIERVDVVTGGAGATYGSDAVTGVVNYILNKKFTGVKYDLNAGVSKYNDGRQYKVGVAMGMPLFEGRGHIEGSFSYFDKDRIPTYARPYNADRQGWARGGQGTAADPYYNFPYGRTIGDPASQGGLLRCTGTLPGNVCGANNTHFYENGVLGPFVFGTPTTVPNLFQGGMGGGYFNVSSFDASLLTKNAFLRASYDIDDNTNIYVNLIASEADNLADWSSMTLSPGTGRGSIMFSDNAWLPADVQARINQGNPSGMFTFSSFFDRIGGRPGIETGRIFQSGSRNRYLAATAGIDGVLADKLTWSAAYTHGENRQEGYIPHNVNVTRQIAAMDAAIDPATGRIVCRVSLGPNANLFPGCVPLNPFGPDSVSNEAYDYVTDYTNHFAYQNMDDVTATASMDLFQLPAGPLTIGMSAERRWHSLRVDSKFNPALHPDCTGLRTCLPNPNPTSLYDQGVVAPLAETNMTVTEAAIEFNVPLLADLPLIQNLSTTLAGRYADYSISGSARTWKIGLNYQVSDALRFRATISADHRAPNLWDLYAPERISTGPYVDELTKFSTSIPTSTSGNPNLKPEQGRTTTVGVIVRPSFIPNLSLSLDYYKIKLQDAMTNLAGSNQDLQKICIASSGTSIYCSLTVRPTGAWIDTNPATNYPTLSYSRAVNSAILQSDGFDAEANYNFQLGDVIAGLPGSVTLRALGTHQPPVKTINYPGAPPAIAVMPANRAVGRIGWTNNDWAVNAQTTWFGKYAKKASLTQFWREPENPSFRTYDLNISKKFEVASKPVNAYLAIQNVFNASPPIFTNAVTNPGLGYPVLASENAMGRYFTFGVRGSF